MSVPQNLNRRVKLPAQKAGPYTVRNNRIHFKLDKGQVYNLFDSYIELWLNVEASEVTSGTSGGVYKVNAFLTDEPQLLLRGSTLVKNCYMRSAKYGVIDDVRAINVLMTKLLELEETEEMRKGKQHLFVSSAFDDNLLRSNLCRELHKEGSVMSRDIESPVRIYLREVFPAFGKDKSFDCRFLDDVEMVLELALDTFTVNPEDVDDMYPSELYKDALDWDSGTARDYVDININIDDLYKSPYWVGAVCHITADGSGTDPIDEYKIISEIDFSRSVADPKLKLIFDSDFDAGTEGGLYENVLVELVPAETVTWTWSYAELNTSVLANPPPKIDSLSYLTYTTEQYNAGGIQNLQKIFQCEPEAQNLVVLFPDPVTSTNLSISNYRVRVDNVDVSDRNLVPHEALELAINYRVLSDMGVNVVNLQEYAVNQTEKFNRYDAQSRTNIICAPLYPTQNYKNVQLNINTTSEINNLYLYKQVLREL